MDSKNSIKVLEFLKANAGKAMTFKEIADALGMEHATGVIGATTSFAKKGLIEKGERTEGEKTFKTVQITELGLQTVLTEDAPKAELSENAVRIMNYLNANEGADITAADLAEALDLAPNSITGVVNGLVKKGLAVREVVDVEMPDESVKQVKFIRLTDEGKAKL